MVVTGLLRQPKAGLVIILGLAFLGVTAYLFAQMIAIDGLVAGMLGGGEADPAAYRRSFLAVVTMLGMMAFGTIGLGAYALVVIARLEGSVAALMRRIEQGDERYDEALPARRDALGRLSQAVEGLFGELRRREASLLAARQLRAEQQKVGDIINFTGGIAHEIRNPLAVLLAIVEGWDETGRRTDLVPVRDALARIQKVLDAVTALSRLEGEEGAIDLNSVLHGILTLVRLDERSRRLRFLAEFDRSIESVAVSQPALTVGLFSLMSWAAAALHDRDGGVAVRTLARPGGVEIEIVATARDGGAAQEGFLTLPRGDEGTALRSVHSLLRNCGAKLVVHRLDGDCRRLAITVPAAVAVRTATGVIA